MKRAGELRLSRAVEEMLERTLGPGHVRAEAAVEMDFDQVHETQEKYDPEGQVVRSTQSTTDNSKSTEAAASVSVQNNLPNADAGANPSGSQEQRQEETTNYEISKTIRILVREQPQIRRISLAVMVDSVASRGADGVTTWAERTPAELAQIATLVRGAIGFNEARGDRVDVVNMRFAPTEEGLEPAQPAAWLRLDKSDWLRLSETGVVALVVVLALLLVVRPLVLRLTLQPQALLAGVGGAESGVGEILPADGSRAGLPGAANNTSGLAAPAETEEMIMLANVEGALRASAVRRAATLIETQPHQSLMKVRNWLSEEAR